MVADLSSLVGLLNGHREEQPQMNGGNTEILMTRDLLGSLSKVSNKELDLDSESGIVYPERCNSPNSPLVSSSTTTTTSISSSNNNMRQQKTTPDSEVQDLNHPPTSTAPINLLLEETCLELKLESSSHYQSVCTLDKVKSALQRAEKETIRKRSPSPPLSSSSSSLQSNSSSSGMFAAGCPGCLLYVIIEKENPKCPRCNAIVSPLVVKKPRIDLNASF